MVQKIIIGIVFVFTLFLGGFFVFHQKMQKTVVEERSYIVVKSYYFGYPFEIAFDKGTTLLKIVQTFNTENEIIKDIYIKQNSS